MEKADAKKKVTIRNELEVYEFDATERLNSREDCLSKGDLDTGIAQNELTVKEEFTGPAAKFLNAN